MNELTIIPLASPGKYLVLRKDCRQIPYERMYRLIKYELGFKWATVQNLITGGPEWVYLVERQYE